MSSSDHSFKLAANPASVSSLKIPEVHTAASAVQLTNQQLIHISAGGVIMPQQPPVASATTVSQVPDVDAFSFCKSAYFCLIALLTETTFYLDSLIGPINSADKKFNALGMKRLKNMLESAEIVNLEQNCTSVFFGFEHPT